MWKDRAGLVSCGYGETWLKDDVAAITTIPLKERFFFKRGFPHEQLFRTEAFLKTQYLSQANKARGQGVEEKLSSGMGHSLPSATGPRGMPGRSRQPQTSSSQLGPGVNHGS